MATAFHYYDCTCTLYYNKSLSMYPQLEAAFTICMVISVYTFPAASTFAIYSYSCTRSRVQPYVYRYYARSIITAAAAAFSVCGFVSVNEKAAAAAAVPATMYSRTVVVPVYRY
eukprot:COSAG01_NODE_7648_length_3115_cov_1.548077_2_plen_114_part_00